MTEDDDSDNGDLAPDEIGEIPGSSGYSEKLYKLNDADVYHVKFKGEDREFRSKIEFDRFRYLNFLYENNIIKNLELQKKWPLIPENQDCHAMIFKADFDYDAPYEFEQDGSIQWTHYTEDAKHKQSNTVASKLKHKLFRHVYGRCVLIVKPDSFYGGYILNMGKRDVTHDFQFLFLNSVIRRLLSGERVVLGLPRKAKSEYRSLELSHQPLSDGKHYSFHAVFFKDGRKRIFNLVKDGNVFDRIKELDYNDFTKVLPATTLEQDEWYKMRKIQIDKKLPSIPIHPQWNPETRK